VGILNVTRDSFSDGGRYLDPDAAIVHGLALAEGGAAIVDVGAESTHPDAEDVTATEEIRRLVPVVEALVAAGVEVSVDTHKPDVIARMLTLGVRMVNDVTGLADPRSRELLAAAGARVVLMFSRSHGARAERRDGGVENVSRDVVAALRDRLETVVAAGIERERIVVDPGMGFFLSRAPEASFRVLAELDRIRRELAAPIMVSVSRKSFLGAATGRPASARGAATLAAELWAWQQGADFIRTHDVRALADAIRTWRSMLP